VPTPCPTNVLTTPYPYLSPTAWMVRPISLMGTPGPHTLMAAGSGGGSAEARREGSGTARVAVSNEQRAGSAA
jgi:hypothetical protein